MLHLNILWPGGLFPLKKGRTRKKIAYLHHCISMPPKTLLSFIRQWKFNGCWSKRSGGSYHTLHIHQYHQELTLCYCSYFSCFSCYFFSSFLFFLTLSTGHQISSPFLYQDCKAPSKPLAETLPVHMEATVSVCVAEIITRQPKHLSSVCGAWQKAPRSRKLRSMMYSWHLSLQHSVWEQVEFRSIWPTWLQICHWTPIQSGCELQDSSSSALETRLGRNYLLLSLPAPAYK